MPEGNTTALPRESNYTIVQHAHWAILTLTWIQYGDQLWTIRLGNNFFQLFFLASVNWQVFGTPSLKLGDRG
jgi:hypothetical protein